MTVKLCVLKYEDDATHSLDCTLCDEKTSQQQFTMITFWDQVTGLSFNLCADHLDMVVGAALKRHREAMTSGEGPLWYLNEDEDPWKEADS